MKIIYYILRSITALFAVGVFAYGGYVQLLLLPPMTWSAVNNHIWSFLFPVTTTLVALFIFLPNRWFLKKKWFYIRVAGAILTSLSIAYFIKYHARGVGVLGLFSYNPNVKLIFRAMQIGLLLAIAQMIAFPATVFLRTYLDKKRS